MQKKIALFVTSIHLLTICMLLFSPTKKSDRPIKHITVRTIQPSVKARSSSATTVAHAPRKQTSPTSSTTIPKKESPTAKTKAPVSKAGPIKSIAKQAPATSKKISQKKPAVVEKNKPAKAKKAPPVEIWQEIDEALAKIEDKGYSKSQSKLDLPQVKSSPSLLFPEFGEIEGGTHEVTPEGTLISFLQGSLNLPEFGEVKIQLTVKKDGSVARLVVLESESQKNKAYLQQHLPHLKFPLIFDTEKTFTLTFCNEI